MESQQALPGTRVQVRKGYAKSELDGMMGTITHRFGHPDYAALDVKLENGLSALFWFHQLDVVDGTAVV